MRRSSFNRLMEERNELIESKARLGADLGHVNEALDGMTAERDRFAEVAAQGETRIGDLATEIADKTRLLDDWSAQITEREARIATLAEGIATLESQRDDLLGERDALKEQAEALVRESADLRDRMGALETRVDDYAAHNHALQADRDAIAAHNHALQADRDAISDHNQALLKDRDAIADHNRSLLEERDKIRAHNAQLVEQFDYFESQLDIARGAGLHFQKAIAAANTGHPVEMTPPRETPDVSVTGALDLAGASKTAIGKLKSAKRTWLKKHIQCPACGGPSLAAKQGDFACPDCGEAFSVTGEGTFNFISPALGIEHAIDPTENVSAHGYDGAAIALLNEVAAAGGMALDCGAGSKSFIAPHLINAEIVDYPSTDILAVGQTLPFKDNSFDAIVSIAVLEHVTDPFACAKELYRVTKPGGKLLVSVPFLQPEHGYPHHYFNMTREGLRRLFRDMGQLENHWVPLTQHPLLALAWFLAVYRVNLPPETGKAFSDVRIGDIIDGDAYEMVLSDIGAHLGRDGRWQLASGHSMILKKE
ncbi:MAG: methyltransferase domain-containing protein [Alphaproteobacteria bacterium]|nr:methyltransferase domain-containing protein [Alphaproteobacteria bacterium]